MIFKLLSTLFTLLSTLFTLLSTLFTLEGYYLIALLIICMRIALIFLYIHLLTNQCIAIMLTNLFRLNNISVIHVLNIPYIFKSILWLI